MRDRGVIYFGLAVFLGTFSIPLWRNAGAKPCGPDPVLPKREKQCVAPAEYMKTAHMKLLIEWREEVVRNGDRSFTAFDGRRYNKSLTQTCLAQCHTQKADFCDRCHNYAAVSIPCWDCHQDAARSAP